MQRKRDYTSFTNSVADDDYLHTSLRTFPVLPWRPVVVTDQSAHDDWTVFAAATWLRPISPHEDVPPQPWVSLMWSQFFVIAAYDDVLLLEAFDQDSLQRVLVYRDFVDLQRLVQIADLAKLVTRLDDTLNGQAQYLSITPWNVVRAQPREHINFSLRSFNYLYQTPAIDRVVDETTLEAYLRANSMTLVVVKPAAEPQLGIGDALLRQKLL